ncbi:hypothetical protein JCM11641_007080 [Rhodosporidiobolus odoratus]
MTTLDASVEAHRLIARFLRSHNYHDALSSFLREAAEANPRLTRLDAPSTDGGHDFQDIVEDWVGNRLARLKVDDPTTPLLDQMAKLELLGKLPDVVRTAFKETTNVLTVNRGVLPRRSWDSSELRFKSELVPCIFTTTVARTVNMYSSETFDLLDSFSLPSPALALAQHPTQDSARYVVCATMEGSLTVLDLVSRQVVVKVKDHTKYVVRATWSPDGRYIATLGYDKLIHLYRFSLSSPSPADEPALLDGEVPDSLASNPTVSLTLVRTDTARTNPEAAVFLPDSTWLVWAARDDHLLHYLQVPDEGKEEDEAAWATEEHNLNENGDAFVSFSVLSIGLHPTLPLLSLQTDTSNARILLYPFHSSTRLLTLHTTASQSEYFNPRHAWLPSGAGVIVNSEDGVVRIVDLQGRVRVQKGAHGPAAPLEGADAEGESEELKSARARARREADKGSSVIRDVEVLPCEGGWKVLSGGFDKTVKVLE